MLETDVTTAPTIKRSKRILGTILKTVINIFTIMDSSSPLQGIHKMDFLQNGNIVQLLLADCGC